MKIYNYTILGVVLIALFTIFGYETGSSQFLAKFGLDSIQNLEAGTLWSKIGLIFGIGTGGSIVIGTFSRTSPTYAIKAGLIMGVLLTLVWDFVWILNKLYESGQTWVYLIFFVIITPLIAGYAISLIEFWEGRD